MIDYLKDNMDFGEKRVAKTYIKESKPIPVTTPKELSQPFLPKMGLFKAKVMTWKELKKKEPFLMLRKNNGDIVTIYNVKEGLFEVKDPKGKAKAAIIIDHTKMGSLKYGKDKYLKVYWADEREATCYPLDVTHDSKMLLIYLKKVILDRVELLKGKKKDIPIAIVMLVLCVITIIGFFLWKGGYINI